MARRRRNNAPRAAADPAPPTPSYGNTGPDTAQSPMGTIGGGGDGGGGYGTGYAGVDPGWKAEARSDPAAQARPGTSEPAWGSHLGVDPPVEQGGLGFARGGPVDSQYADETSDEDDTVNSGTGAKWTISAYHCRCASRRTQQGYADGGVVEDESAGLGTSSYRDQEAVRLAEVERRQMEEEAQRRQ